VDILDELENYCGQDYVPMHMPGAKRNTQLFQMGNPYGIDITEIQGFDNMHHADGMIARSFERAAKLFGAKESLYLVNGSSAGILSAICGATHKGDTILVARNCHISVYNAMYLQELMPVYLYPEEYTHGIYGRMSVAEVRRGLEEHPEATAVVLTSPTYEGMMSDIKAIADVVHEKGKILIVDEAHGAHFPFHEVFPVSAISQGADIVIQSIHKTLPAFTQTALLHMNGNQTLRERVRRYWNIYQSTSPSYILMAGIDRCLTILERQGTALFDEYVQRLIQLRKRLGNLKQIRLLLVDDISKIVLLVPDGKKLQEKLLNQYHIELEMASLHYVIAMTSIGDTDVYYERFAQALEALDCEMDTAESLLGNVREESKEREQFQEENVIELNQGAKTAEKPYDVYEEHRFKSVQIGKMLRHAEVRIKPYDTVIRAEQGVDIVALKDVAGRIATTTIVFYPPGIPVVNPGEIFTAEIIDYIYTGVQAGLEVLGLVEHEQDIEPFDRAERLSGEKNADRIEEPLPVDLQVEKREKEVYVSCLK